MPKTISKATVAEEFDDMVQFELQSRERLMNSCREYDTDGEVFNAPYFDAIEMQPSDFGCGDINNTDVPQRNVPIVQGDYKLRTCIGKGYQTLFNYDVIMGHVRQHARALGRFNDSLKIQALIAADAGFTEENNNLVTAQGLVVQDLVQAYFKLIDNGADDDEMTMYTSARNMPSFFNDNDFKSWDQNRNRPLMTGSIGTYMNVDIRVLSSKNASNRLPGGLATPNNYVVDRESLAVAYNRRPRASVFSEDSQDRTVVVSVATAGSEVMRIDGICKITTVVEQLLQFSAPNTFLDPLNRTNASILAGAEETVNITKNENAIPAPKKSKK